MAAKMLSFQARSLKFGMELYLDHPQPKMASHNYLLSKKQNGLPKNKTYFQQLDGVQTSDQFNFFSFIAMPLTLFQGFMQAKFQTEYP